MRHTFGKNKLAVVLAASLVVVFGASSAFAAPPEGKGQGKDEVKSETTVTVTDGKGKPEKSGGSVTGATYGGDTVTGATYGGHGLQNALEHVKNEHARSVIENLLLTKYGIDVKDSVTLSDAADELSASGDNESAEEVQAEAVKSDVTNLELYKKLGHIKAKLGKTGIKAYVNGSEPIFDVAPVYKGDRVLVPFRAISAALRADVQWNPDEMSVTVTRGDTVVKLVIGSDIALVNGTEVKLDVAADTMNDRTMVPVRFLSEAFKATVKWEAETESVVIYEE